MAKYKIRINKMYDDSGNVSSTFEDILDKERNVAIPKSTDNADYLAYLEWAKTNTAEAAD